MAMNKLVMAVAAFSLLAGAATAATSGTTVAAAVNPYMTPPVTGYVSATVTSTASPRIALPTISKTINSLVCDVRDSAGRSVPRDIEVSGTDIVISTATGITSGTLAVGDTVKCIISYER